MDPAALNYLHLRHFWMVAREGSIARACQRLHLAQPTISGQMRDLEQAFGGRLYTRVGRSIELTGLGRLVLRHCDEIFAVGAELAAAVAGRGQRLVVGLSEDVPKAVAQRLLDPVLHLDPAVALTCAEDRFEALLGGLAAGACDLVLADQPVSGRDAVAATSHLLGGCGVAVLAPPAFASLATDFPASLDTQPVLAPLPGTPMRIAFDQWCDTQGIRPRIAGQCQDAAMRTAFAQGGHGVVIVPAVAADDPVSGLAVIGRIASLRETFHLICPERRHPHPAIAAIRAGARRLFSDRR
jgi:LysR family transcriptional regulator, transcriptional activator of nhaA